MSFSFFKPEFKDITLKNTKQAKLAVVTIDAPNLNALSTAVLKEIPELMSHIKDQGARVAVFTGTGKAFIAGADISEMKDLSVEQAFEFANAGHTAFESLESEDVITIAAVNGYAFGGGLEFALACDIRIFSDEALVGLPEVSLGLIPGFGGTQRLARQTGEGNAKYLIYTASRIDAAESLRLGIAQKTVTSDQLLTEAEKTATKILSHGPLAIKAASRLITTAPETKLPEGLQNEAKEFSQIFGSTQAKEGLEAFLEKRAPEFEK